MGVFERWRVVITRCLLSIGGWRLEHTDSTCMADLLNSTSWNRPSTFFSTSKGDSGSASRTFLTRGGQCFLGVIFTTVFGGFACVHSMLSGNKFENSYKRVFSKPGYRRCFTGCTSDTFGVRKIALSPTLAFGRTPVPNVENYVHCSRNGFTL